VKFGWEIAAELVVNFMSARRVGCRAGVAQMTSSAARARFSAINMRGVLFHVSGPEETYQCDQIDGLDTDQAQARWANYRALARAGG
jgi:hypothetical protein